MAIQYGTPSADGQKIDQGSDGAFLGRLASARNSTGMLGDQPVTVVNLNPYKLAISHPMWSGLEVPAHELGSGNRYSARVITQVEYQRIQGVDRNDDAAMPFFPIQLAQEFLNAQARNNAGGVFIIKGDLSRNPALERTPEFEAAYQVADEYMVAYCLRMKQAADNEWHSENHKNARNIQRQHRTAARLLLDRRLLDVAPDWLDANHMTINEAPVLCPACKTKPNKGSVICLACGEILDPAAAFKDGKIDETHQSLEKLTRAQVKELGISGYVAETADERPARLKATRPKPMSDFERKMIDDQKKGA